MLRFCTLKFEVVSVNVDHIAEVSSAADECRFLQQCCMFTAELPPVVVGHGTALQVQQLTGVNLAGVPQILGAFGSRVCDVQDVVTGHGEGAAGPGGEGQVDPDVEGVS